MPIQSSRNLWRRSSFATWPIMRCRQLLASYWMNSLIKWNKIRHNFNKIGQWFVFLYRVVWSGSLVMPKPITHLLCTISSMKYKGWFFCLQKVRRHILSSWSNLRKKWTISIYSSVSSYNGHKLSKRLSIQRELIVSGTKDYCTVCPKSPTHLYQATRTGEMDKSPRTCNVKIWLLNTEPFTEVFFWVLVHMG